MTVKFCKDCQFYLADKDRCKKTGLVHPNKETGYCNNKCLSFTPKEWKGK